MTVLEPPGFGEMTKVMTDVTLHTWAGADTLADTLLEEVFSGTQ